MLHRLQDRADTPVHRVVKKRRRLRNREQLAYVVLVGVLQHIHKRAKLVLPLLDARAKTKHNRKSLILITVKAPIQIASHLGRRL